MEKERNEMEQDKKPEGDILHNLKLDASPGGFRKRRVWLVAAGCLLAAAIVAAVVWKTAGSDDKIQYKTQKAQIGSLTVIVTATGTLQPTNDNVTVGSELSGIVKTVAATYNDRVKVGQILARLDTSKLEAQVKQYRASLAAAKAKVVQCQATAREYRLKLEQYRKVRALSGNKVPSQTEMDAAEAALDRAIADEASAKAAVTQSQATLDTYELDLSKAVIRSPINGVVLTRSIEPGQTVAAAYQAPTLFTLAADLSQMELHVNVDEADIGKIEVGQEAVFTVAAYPNRTFHARITQARYGSTTTSGVVTYETLLRVNNGDMALRPGMTATADITARKVDNALLVPNTALRFAPPVAAEEKKASGGLVASLLPRPPASGKKTNDARADGKKEQHVWTLKDGQLQSIAVTVGLTNGVLTEITGGGVKPEMELVVDIMERKK